MASSVLTRSVRRHEKDGGEPTLPCPGCGGAREVRVAPGRCAAAPVVLGRAVRDVRRPWPDSGLVAPGPTDTAAVTASSPATSRDTPCRAPVPERDVPSRRGPLDKHADPAFGVAPRYGRVRGKSRGRAPKLRTPLGTGIRMKGKPCPSHKPHPPRVARRQSFALTWTRMR
jgi:hypothetical protein